MALLRRLALFVVVLTAVVLIGAGVAGLVLWQRVHEPFQAYEEERIVDVPPGLGVNAIGDRLVEEGVVRDRLSFRLAVWLSGSGHRLQAGEYRFAGPMSAPAVVDKLVRGDVVLYQITFREGLTIAQKARLYEERGFGPAEAFVEAAQDVSLIAGVDPDAADLEGYLYPETYTVSRSVTAPQLVRAMVQRFLTTYDEELREAAEARGFTTREVVTLASLIEKETGLDGERSLVSAVFNNRLRIGMWMQCDPTVIYALEREGRYTGRLTRADLQFDSPYNTYRYGGLPPGPIAAPGRQALEAALRPADVDYLYFVSRNDGSHVFARTLAEHNRNVRRWQIEYFRELRARQQ